MRALEAVLLTPVRLGLGGLFCFSGYVKLSNVQTFADSVKAFRIFDLDKVEHLAVLTTYTVPWLEMLSGVLLVLGLWSRPAALAIAGQLIAFTIGILSVLGRGLEIKCGCFGDYEWPCAGPIATCHVFRNVFLLMCASVLVWRGGGPLGLDGLRRGGGGAAKGGAATDGVDRA